MDWFCDNCEKKFRDKYNYERHINKKTPCKKNINDINDTTNNEPSNNELSNNELSNNELIDVIKELTHEVKELKDRVKILEKKDTYTFNQYNISLIAHGIEDSSFITEVDKKKLIMSGIKCIPKYIELVHCNENKLENKNVCISSKKNMNKVTVIKEQK
jgi:hypothetical protein